MSNGLLKKFKGDRKYFAIVLFVLFLLLVSGILIPILTQKNQGDWDKIRNNKVIDIESSVNKLFQEKQSKLLNISSSLSKQLASTLTQSKTTYESLIQLINTGDFAKYSVEVLAPNGRLIAWNDKIALKQEDILPLSFPAGEAHFYRSELVTYLTVTDTVFVENDQFYYVVSEPIEKHYSFVGPYYKEKNFSRDLTDDFNTQFNIEYNPFAAPSRDGRNYSYDLLNNKNNKIGVITFAVPNLDYSLNKIKSEASQIQSIFVVIGFFFLGFSFKREFNALKSRTLKLLILALYCSLYRLLFYTVDFPANILNGAITESAYFSSTFGEGIVKSPIEFFITVLLLLPISVQAIKLSLDYVHNCNAKKLIILKILGILPLIVVSFLLLRSLNASIRSVVFDSTLRYFKSPDIIPGLPTLLMELNTLLLGISILLAFASIYLIIIAFLPLNRFKQKKIFFVILFIIFFSLSYVSLRIQSTPLITPVLGFVIITLAFIFLYYIYFTDAKHPIYLFVFGALISSFITISLLNYFNLELERESLKTTALEINRSNDNLLQFFLNETLTNAIKNDELIRSYSLVNSNYDTEAFIIWSTSSLQKESLNSSVSIYNANLKQIGYFGIGQGVKKSKLDSLQNLLGTNSKLIQILPYTENNTKKLLGLAVVKQRGIILGYVSATINVDILNLGKEKFPEFLESKKNIINSVIDPQKLKIFEFIDTKLTNVFGDIYPSLDQTKPIINSNFSADNEAWLNLSLSGENYLTYALKIETEKGTKITSVSVLEKNLSWNLFNFFKIFIVQSIFIFILFLVAFISQFKTFRYSFRTQLLIAFLLVSILPVVILAVYNRQIVKQKSQNAILKELSERCDYVENHINAQIENDRENNLTTIFSHAGEELGISFSIYEGSNLIFNSRNQYYKVGLFGYKLDPEAYYELNYLNYREYLTQEKIDYFSYNAFFKKSEITGRYFIISVNDAFNKVNLTFSVIDVDVFLFGIYSFATILIILISTFLANRISSPIRRLTKATASIAHGDLNVEIHNDQRGELKELLDGFNSMTSELQKNQVELAELERENAWKEMAKQVAHEIKNPLTPMKLAVQQLMISYKDKNQKFDSMFKRISKTLLNQIESLNQIATEFSRFARMPNYKIEELDLIPVVLDSINLFVDEGIEINFQSKLKSVIIEGDKVQLRRILINLIRNSIQANSSKIDLELTLQNKNIAILLKDNGTGIPEKFRDKIFEANFTTKKRGMGLGLKLTKRFIESIKGEIKLKSSSDGGTVFEITVPFLNVKMQDS
ncbi:MAG TPA: ATP-binding protein [Ignavibacteriaceae bacterium]|nr:ATP-binding protein [Ignavibacteriaceae bacterium]